MLSSYTSWLNLTVSGNIDADMTHSYYHKHHDSSPWFPDCYGSFSTDNVSCFICMAPRNNTAVNHSYHDMPHESYIHIDSGSNTDMTHSYRDMVSGLIPMVSGNNTGMTLSLFSLFRGLVKFWNPSDSHGLGTYHVKFPLCTENCTDSYKIIIYSIEKKSNQIVYSSGK